MAFMNRRKRFYSVGVDAFRLYLSQDKKDRIHNDDYIRRYRKAMDKEKILRLSLILRSIMDSPKEKKIRLLESA